jgi:hypothetical protein
MFTLNGDSIYGATYGPVQNVPGLRTAAGPKSLYVHLFDETPPMCTLAGIDPRVLSARLLANRSTLRFRQNEKQARDRNPAVPARPRRQRRLEPLLTDEELPVSIPDLGKSATGGSPI